MISRIAQDNLFFGFGPINGEIGATLRGRSGRKYFLFAFNPESLGNSGAQRETENFFAGKICPLVLCASTAIALARSEFDLPMIVGRSPQSVFGHLSQARIKSAAGSFAGAQKEAKQAQAVALSDQQKQSIQALIDRLQAKQDINK